MVKLYFLGGEDVRKRTSAKINKRAFLEAGGKPTVLVFPWTRRIEKKEYRKILIDYFKDLGARRVEFAELSDSIKKIKRKVNSADIIYLPGGDPRILLKRLKNKKANILLKKYSGIVVGNSAGSLVLCSKYAAIKKQDEESKTALKPGIGLTNLTVAVHYGRRAAHLAGQNSTEELRKLSKKLKIKIYAIPENGALVYDGKNINAIGNVYLFYKGKKTKW